MADIRNTGTWQRIERGLSEMANLMSRGEYNLSLVKSRQVMEQIVRLYAGQNFVVYSDLADTIEKLYQGHYIGKMSRDSFHTIRMLGNKAVHEGDNDAQDAERSYKLLEQEIQTFVSGSTRSSASGGENAAGRASLNERRTAEGRSAGNENAGSPELAGQRQSLEIPGERTFGNRAGSGRGREAVSSQQKRRSTEKQRAAADGGRRRYDKLDDRSSRDREKIPTREDRLRAQRSGQRTQRRPQRGGVNLYDILRILIPVICVILLVILIKSFMGGGSGKTETSPAAQTESSQETESTPVTTEPQTTEAETTAAVVRYKIKGDAVNIRYADNDNRVYAQLKNGTEIGEVQEIPGSDKVRFTYDGQEVTVNKNYIVPVEGSGASEAAGTGTTVPAASAAVSEAAQTVQ